MFKKWAWPRSLIYLKYIFNNTLTLNPPNLLRRSVYSNSSYCLKMDEIGWPTRSHLIYRLARSIKFHNWHVTEKFHNIRLCVNIGQWEHTPFLRWNLISEEIWDPFQKNSVCNIILTSLCCYVKMVKHSIWFFQFTVYTNKASMKTSE